MIRLPLTLAPTLIPLLRFLDDVFYEDLGVPEDDLFNELASEENQFHSGGRYVFLWVLRDFRVLSKTASALGTVQD